ncbi:GNAT family N-acetyltransferase [Actinoallomurus iriomotensis]|uniref:GNAT family N-acetyltransferase n=1 Tax=Actinoallomurus iriomotensis TaxID=478107 RepID=UPI003D7F47CF
MPPAAAASRASSSTPRPYPGSASASRRFRGTIEPGPREATIAARHQIRPLAPAAADDDAIVTALTGLVNEVYAESEKGLWADGAVRTTERELAGLVRAGEIAVARLDGRITGCVRVHRLDPATSEFGLLAADPRHRGLGVGRELVRFAERRARAQGAGRMRLELLVPRERPHPSKEFLAAWYGRLGYVVAGKGTMEDSHPHLAPLLATPCDVMIYEKDLRAGTPIDDLAARLREFAADREWEPFHTPKNLAMAVAGEAGELLAEFQWLTPEESAAVMTDPAAGARVRGELADVMTYLVRLADTLGVDLIQAAHAKLDESERRYDPETYRGTARKAPPLP